MFSNSLGTALGDFLADDPGLAYEGSAVVFPGLLAIVAAGHFLTSIYHTLLFWTAFILARPLGATLGDLPTKQPHMNGGLVLSRRASAAAIAAFMIACIVLMSQKPGTHPCGQPSLIRGE